MASNTELIAALEKASLSAHAVDTVAVALTVHLMFENVAANVVCRAAVDHDEVSEVQVVRLA